VKFRVGLLGGTFDPVHNGHVSIAQAYLSSLYVDAVWIIPAAFPPHKTDLVANFIQRNNMLHLAFDGINGIVIDPVESTLPDPGFTIQTLKHFRQLYNDFDFYWCIGSDNLITFTSWYRHEDILDLCNLLVAKRPGSIIENIPELVMKKCLFIDHNPINISSSEIRESIKTNKFSADIPKNVLRYIKDKRLYQ